MNVLVITENVSFIVFYLDVPTQDTELLLKLYNWFPGDVGCLCVFFLNFLQLEPGQALYLAPNEPHAYIFGGELIIVIMVQCAESACQYL